VARHSDPKLTMAVYGRAQLHDLGRAVERLPDLKRGPGTEAAALKATGTTDARGRRHVPQHVPDGDAGRDSLRIAESQEGGGDETAPAATPRICKGLRPVESRCDRLTEAPRPGLEPGTNRLTAGCSTIELSGNGLSHADPRGTNPKCRCFYRTRPSPSQGVFTASRVAAASDYIMIHNATGAPDKAMGPAVQRTKFAVASICRADVEQTEFPPVAWKA
jgi:hypothetical protein